MTSKKFESSRQKFAEKLFAAYPKLGATPDEAFAKIAALDPSATQKNKENQYVYLEWICSRILKVPPREQDLYKIREDLEAYSSLTRLDKFRASRKGTVFYRPFVNAEISQYSISTLAETLLAIGDLKDRKKSASDMDNERAQAESQSLILYNGPEGRIVVPTTMEASQYWGKGTKWCISATKSENLFDRYYDEGKNPIIMFMPKGTREKFAFNDHDRSSARNMLDEGIVNSFEKPAKEVPPNITLLGDFIVAALQSPDFKIEKIESDPHLTRAFHLFALWNAPVYNRIVSKVGQDNLPDALKLKNLVPFCVEYIKTGKIGRDGDDEDESHMDNKRALVRRFALTESVITPLVTDPAYQGHYQSILGDVEPIDTADIIQRIAHETLTPPATPFATPEECLADFKAKYQKIDAIQKLGSDHFSDVVSEMADEAIMDYMKAVPKTFWENEDFAVDFISIGYIWGSNFIDQFPEAYNHTKVMHHLLSVMDIDLLSAAIKDGDFKKAWSGRVDGVPLVEVAANMPDSSERPLINDLTAALLLYEAIGDTKDLDLSPIVRKVEELHPDGFDEIYKIQYAAEHMPKCDFTTLLEKSVQQNPELFADVAPEKQTMAMAIAAVKHDPGSLADMAAHLFAGNTRPPELTAAFNKLPPNSIEREAVADYFTVPEVK